MTPLRGARTLAGVTRPDGGGGASEIRYHAGARRTANDPFARTLTRIGLCRSREKTTKAPTGLGSHGSPGKHAGCSAPVRSSTPRRFGPDVAAASPPRAIVAATNALAATRSIGSEGSAEPLRGMPEH
jgi:hypothetical protein